MEMLVTTLTALLPNIPLYIIWLAGIGLAINLRRKDGRVAAFAAGGLTLLLAQSLCAAVYNINLPIWLSNNGGSAQTIGLVFAALGFFNACVSSVSWILILIALFSDRD